MKKIAILRLLIPMIVLAAAICCVQVFCIKQRIVYVRSAYLLSEYVGMKEARQIFQRKQELWKANADTLKNEYQHNISKYIKDKNSLKQIEIKQQEELLKKEEDHLVQYLKTIETKTKTEDERLTQGVLTQVNQYVEKYGRQHNYDMIIGTTLSGNLLYGKDALDITDEVLKGLNAEYYSTGEQKK